jgi:hypothetical protein
MIPLTSPAQAASVHRPLSTQLHVYATGDDSLR